MTDDARTRIEALVQLRADIAELARIRAQLDAVRRRIAEVHPERPAETPRRTLLH